MLCLRGCSNLLGRLHVTNKSDVFSCGFFISCWRVARLTHEAEQKPGTSCWFLEPSRISWSPLILFSTQFYKISNFQTYEIVTWQIRIILSSRKIEDNVYSLSWQRTFMLIHVKLMLYSLWFVFTVRVKVECELGR